MDKEYYISHSSVSDPGKYANLLCCFPNAISEICNKANQLFLHYADFNLFSISDSEVAYDELNARFMEKIIGNIVTKSDLLIEEERKPRERILGVCRDTALLLCSVLRSRGIPARLRAGFITYFIPGLFLDSIFLEYFDKEDNQWHLVDTRTTQLHIDHYQLNIDFNLTNVPGTRFISAASAWNMCRFKNADPVRFGSRQHRGLFTIRNRMIQDLALLNKQETLIWDVWGPMLGSVIVDYDILDNLSDVLMNCNRDISAVNNFYLNAIFKIPNQILVDNPFVPAEWVSIAKH
ncbi:MAG: transglutaminase-like domain-containing protein [Gammaproteobacteria bacterium]|nr:transglutaminase-like domain-containing protein [Gammaproteobacteria bacterium]